MNAKFYPAPWGRKIWVITSAVTGGFLTMSIVLPLLASLENPNGRWVLWLVPGLLCLILGITSLWVIRRFELTDDAILVRRSFWANRIPLETIEAAETDADACRGAWKTIGNDGLFAMHGRFRSKRLGKFQAYVTNPANAVVLRVPGDIIVISPENPRSFVKELERRHRRQEGS